VGFEPTIPMFERAKTVHALDCAAAVIGARYCQRKYKIQIPHFGGIEAEKQE
jgi:hypothetical protein